MNSKQLSVKYVAETLHQLVEGVEWPSLSSTIRLFTDKINLAFPHNQTKQAIAQGLTQTYFVNKIHLRQIQLL